MAATPIFCKKCGDLWWYPGSHQCKAPVENRAMALSNKEKQEAFRARNAMLGLTEVRGVFLPPSLHAELKEQAKKLLAKHKPLEESPAVRNS
jgi:hypothetical protein